MYLKSKLSVALIGLGLLSSLHANAFSLVVPSGTEVEFGFNIFDASTVTYIAGAASPGTPICTTTGGCDTAAGQPGSGAPGAIFIPVLGGYEDSWGVGNVSQITDIYGNPLWTGSASERITAMFYGLVDDVVTYTGTIGLNQQFEAFALGGRLDLYTRPGNTVNVTGGPGARVDIDTYPTATNGTPFLSLAFSPGVIYGDTVHTFQSSFSTGRVAGQGSGYLDILGGDYAWLFDSDGVMDPNGGYHDFVFDVTVNAQGVPAGWTVRGQGQMNGEIPVPTPFVLVASGLLALAALRRRRPAA